MYPSRINERIIGDRRLGLRDAGSGWEEGEGKKRRDHASVISHLYLQLANQIESVVS